VPLTTIPWHRRFEAQVIAAITVIAIVTLAAVVAATTRVVTRNAFRRADAALDGARLAFDRLVQSRAEFAAAQTELIAKLPVFRAHLTDARIATDAATIHAMAEQYRIDLAADFCIVTDAAGSWMGHPGWQAGVAPPAALLAAIDSARVGMPQTQIVAIGNRLLLVVAEPAGFADEVLGTLTAGYGLGDDVARELAHATRFDVNLLAGRQISGSSLAPATRRALGALAASGTFEQVDARATMRRLDASQYIGAAFPLPVAGGTARLVLLQDWNATQVFLAELRLHLVGVGVATLALIVGAGLVFSRRMTRPLRDIAEIAGDIAAGQWDRRIPARGSAEAVATAEAFNAMTASLSHWHAEARTQAEQLTQSQKMEAVGRLAGGVAHDFNNMLTVINGQSEELLTHVDNRDAREGLEQIREAGERAASLTRQLLAFSRKQVLAPRALDLGDVVANMGRMLRRLIGEDIRLVTTVDPGVRRVLADPAQIEQVLLNLAVNARDAMPRGGELRIAVSHIAIQSPRIGRHGRVDAGQYVMLAVTDTGCGMDADTQTHIFEPFFTTKEAGRGTGLGLATVYGSVAQIGGAIEVESAPDRGTTFRIFLPGVDAVAEPAVVTRAPVAQGTETVLLVEDEAMVRNLTVSLLRKNGYLVLEAAGPDEALEIGRSYHRGIDLLLTDVIMPDMNGRDLADNLLNARPGMKVLFMSGYSDERIDVHGMNGAGVAFLQKPFSRESLTRKVRETLEAQA